MTGGTWELFLSTPSEGFTRLRVPLVALGGREGGKGPASLWRTLWEEVGVLLGREEQPPCEQTCSRATLPIHDLRTQQDETKRTSTNWANFPPSQCRDFPNALTKIRWTRCKQILYKPGNLGKNTVFFTFFFIKDPHSLTRIPFIHSEKDPSPPHISNKKQLLVLENNQRTDKKVSAICKIIWIFPVLSENISCTLWKVGCLFRSFNSGKCCWSKVGINKSHANLSRLLAKTIFKTEKGEKSGTQGLLSWKRDKVGPTG